jgi:hypothetical protein
VKTSQKIAAQGVVGWEAWGAQLLSCVSWSVPVASRGAEQSSQVLPSIR